jgi:hypothetical protein
MYNYFQNVVSPNEISMAVEKIILHPNFKPDPRTSYLDKMLTGLAIIRLKKPVPDSPSVGVVCLPLDAAETFNNDEMFAIGWGKSDAPNSKDKLQYGAVRAMDNDNCNTLYTPYRKKIAQNKKLINNDVICTLRGFDELEACARDVGGNNSNVSSLTSLVQDLGQLCIEISTIFKFNYTPGYLSKIFSIKNSAHQT